MLSTQVLFSTDSESHRAGSAASPGISGSHATFSSSATAIPNLHHPYQIPITSPTSCPQHTFWPPTSQRKIKPSKGSGKIPCADEWIQICIHPPSISFRECNLSSCLRLSHHQSNPHPASHPSLWPKTLSLPRASSLLVFSNSFNRYPLYSFRMCPSAATLVEKAKFSLIFHLFMQLLHLLHQVCQRNHLCLPL